MKLPGHALALALAASPVAPACPAQNPLALGDVPQRMRGR